MAGPKVVVNNGKVLVEYTDFAHADYVENSLQKKFSLSLTGKVDVREYQGRVLAMANVYRVLGITNAQRGNWSVLSFRTVTATDAELQQAQTQTRTRLQGKIYRFEIYRPTTTQPRPVPNNPRKSVMEVNELVTLFVTPLNILLKPRNGTWSSRRI